MGDLKRVKVDPKSLVQFVERKLHKSPAMFVSYREYEGYRRGLSDSLDEIFKALSELTEGDF